MIEFSDLWRGHPINESVTTPCIAPHNLTNLEGTDGPLGASRSSQINAPSAWALRCGARACSPRSSAGISNCSVHPREDMHFINANQLANGIARANIAGIGPTEKFVGADAAQFYPKIFGRTGIIYIQDYWRRSSDGDRPTGDHIDVWNGYRSSAKWLMEWFSWLGYYSNYAGAGEIWFWEVK